MDRAGFCIWFTGLSAAGKSTTAEALTRLLREVREEVVLLDGDVVRRQNSHNLGFTREDRDTNVRRIGLAASEAVRSGHAVVVAAISPYRSTRGEVRAAIGADRFVEVFVDTPLEVCAQRDPKGLYARARLGQITRLTGVDDPYEPPLAAELVLDTVAHGPEENARQVVDLLIRRGWIQVHE